jgi:hypothetical protein
MVNFTLHPSLPFQVMVSTTENTWSWIPDSGSGCLIPLPKLSLLTFVRLLSEEAKSGRVLELDELLILNHVFQQNQIASPEAAKLTQKPESLPAVSA